MKRSGFGGLLFLAAGAMPAGAADYSGIMAGGYQHTNGGGDGYSVEGAGLASFGHFNAQLDGGYQRATLSGIALDDGGVEGDLFWRSDVFSLGGSVRYDDLKASTSVGTVSVSISDHITSYGGFAEWYLGSHLTLEAKGGKVSGLVSGSYAAVGSEIYLSPHISLQPIYQYTDFGLAGHQSTYGAGLEIFLSQRFPASLGASYGRTSGGGASSDSVMVSLSYRFGGDRASLASWDRTGPTSWNGGFNL